MTTRRRLLKMLAGAVAGVVALPKVEAAVKPKDVSVPSTWLSVDPSNLHSECGRSIAPGKLKVIKWERVSTQDFQIAYEFEINQ